MATKAELQALAELLNTQASQLETLIADQLAVEDSLMTPAQMHDAIILIGELTVATSGLAIGQLQASANMADTEYAADEVTISEPVVSEPEDS